MEKTCSCNRDTNLGICRRIIEFLDCHEWLGFAYLTIRLCSHFITVPEYNSCWTLIQTIFSSTDMRIWALSLLAGTRSWPGSHLFQPHISLGHWLHFTFSQFFLGPSSCSQTLPQASLDLDLPCTAPNISWLLGVFSVWTQLTLICASSQAPRVNTAWY